MLRHLGCPLRFRSSLLRVYSTDIRYNAASTKSTSTPFVRIVGGIYKTYKPLTPSIRHLRRPLTPHLFSGKPLRQLTVAKRETGGRNSNGRVTVRGRGGGHKRRIRIVDFMRNEPGIQDVVRIEYDPNRSAHLALLKSRNKAQTQPWSYIIAPEGLRPGHTVESFRHGIPDGLIPGFVDHGKKISNQASQSVFGFYIIPSDRMLRRLSGNGSLWSWSCSWSNEGTDNKSRKCSST